MMYPILCKVKYETLHLALKSKQLWIQVGFSIVMNWIVAPLLMVSLSKRQNVDRGSSDTQYLARTFMGIPSRRERPSRGVDIGRNREVHRNGTASCTVTRLDQS